MITLQHVLAALARMDVDPSEILIPRTVYIHIMRQARKILREEGYEGNETETITE